MVRAQPVDEHVGAALHLEGDSQLLQRLFLQHYARLLVKEHVRLALLDLFAVNPAREQLDTHLHAVAALLRVDIRTGIGFSVPERRREFHSEALLS